MWKSIGTAVAVVASGVSVAHADRKPNVVLIFADDLGYKDTGFTGSDYYETPNLDAMAKAGLVFNNAYAGAANCAPSRACLLSGQYTPRHGVFAVDSTDRGPKPLMRMVPIPNNKALTTDEVTVAEALKAGGYATAMYGKWHLTDKKLPDAKTKPTDQGFDVYSDPREENANRKQDLPDDPKGIYTITNDACKFIEANKEKPFFVYIAHHAIHSSLEARPSSLKHFESKPKGKYHDNPLYAACTYDLDDGVGIVLKKIRDLGLENDTLVVFTSDNGGTNQSPQEPLRGNKGGYYEGGTREPFVAYWPGKIKPGTTDLPTINQDLYPTFLDVTGTTKPADKILDGVSLKPAFEGESMDKERPIFWHFPGYLNEPVIRGRDPVFRTRPVTVMRKGDWKLFLYHEEWQLDGGRAKVDSNNAVELYNLATDPGERENIATKQTAKRDELLDTMLAWIKSTNAPLPTETNPKYDKDAKVKVKAGKAAE